MGTDGKYMEKMNMIRKIKNNLFVRNCWIAVGRLRIFFKGKEMFAQCSDNVIITPPHIVL